MPLWRDFHNALKNDKSTLNSGPGDVLGAVALFIFILVVANWLFQIILFT